MPWKNTHSAFRIRTDIAYAGLGLINCILIFVALILVFFFIDYSAVGLDGEIFFCCHKILFHQTTFLHLPLLSSPFQHRVSTQLQAYGRPKSSARAFMLRGVSRNAPIFLWRFERSFVRMIVRAMSILIGKLGPGPSTFQLLFSLLPH